MAHLDRIEDLAALYWWRRDAAGRAETKEPEPLSARLAALAASAAPPPMPRILDLPGNRLQLNAETRRAGETPALQRKAARDPDRLAASRIVRRNARVALGAGLIATVAAAAAAIRAAALHAPVALGIGLAGTFVASLALYHAALWFRPRRTPRRPNMSARGRSSRCPSGSRAKSA